MALLLGVSDRQPSSSYSGHIVTKQAGFDRSIFNAIDVPGWDSSVYYHTPLVYLKITAGINLPTLSVNSDGSFTMQGMGEGDTLGLSGNTGFVPMCFLNGVDGNPVQYSSASFAEALALWSQNGGPLFVVNQAQGSTLTMQYFQQP